ncbi:kinesin-domain-containing protein [Lichtheimia hyalospora FSU 10163]|nr:kinesin-domain-containing protein [Lichtheimia hyalospora FSU 10163]
MHEKDMALEDVRKKRVTTQQEIISMEKCLMQAAQRRRKLYNTIQELKGNIRVFCRVRPVLRSDKSQQHTQIRYSSDDITDTLELEGDVSSMLGKRSTKKYSFTFDRIFNPSTTQSECYEDIAYLVQSALDGYSVCIFAYGQTGSGKTYTMQGPATDVTTETAGMIPRAIQQIYDLIQELKKEGWEYSMEGQFLEIYNETIHDLLGDPSMYGKVKHEIHHAKNGRTTVTQLKTVHLDSPATLHAMLRRANFNRATGATNMNERSSRSHSVFTLRITGFNRSAKETCTGVLNLVDLAGSERLALSGATGERLKETQAINKSLSSLGDVIHALNNNSKTESNAHVPYRNSKLTYLLQNSLGGTSKTLMFVNISPLAEHFNETLCSLRFASKVNACRVELPQRVMK